MHRITNKRLIERIVNGQRNIIEKYPNFNMEHPEGAPYDTMRDNSDIWPNPDDMFTNEGIVRQLDDLPFGGGFINFAEIDHNQIVFGKEYVGGRPFFLN